MAPDVTDGLVISSGCYKNCLTQVLLYRNGDEILSDTPLGPRAPQAEPPTN